MLTLIIVALFAYYVTHVYRTRQIIHNHEGDAYLIRYFILKTQRFGRVYLHHIIRSDYDRALHDHPWNFRTFILWGGYREWADMRQVKLRLEIPKWVQNFWSQNENGFWSSQAGASPLGYRDFKAPTTLRRGAGWRHRLEIEPGKSAWTLVFTSTKVRSWGFWQMLGTAFESFCNWKNYDYINLTCNDDPEYPARSNS